MSPDVTVLVVYHNRRSGVDLSMRSLDQQDYDRFQVVVMDDGSTDDSFQLLKQYQSDRIAVRTQRNQGFTRTMMQLAAEADTEFIAVHGAGDESLPDRLSRQVAFLRAHPNVVAVGCGIENVDEMTGRRWSVLPPNMIKRGPILSGFGISHGEVMFRRDAYLRAGGYRDIFPVGQATDLFRRLSRLGDFGYILDILYRRHLRLDGVNAQLDLLARRDILNALSDTVHRTQIAAGAVGGEGRLRDDLDKYGMLLPYILPPNRGIARHLARAAVKFWTWDDRPMALRLARRSLRERVTLGAFSSYLAILLGIGPFKKPLMKLVARASSGRHELDMTRLNEAHPAIRDLDLNPSARS